MFRRVWAGDQLIGRNPTRSEENRRLGQHRSTLPSRSARSSGLPVRELWPSTREWVACPFDLPARRSGGNSSGDVSQRPGPSFSMAEPGPAASGRSASSNRLPGVIGMSPRVGYPEIPGSNPPKAAHRPADDHGTGFPTGASIIQTRNFFPQTLKKNDHLRLDLGHSPARLSQPDRHPEP